jgi:preprotein translocase subunit YajC
VSGGFLIILVAMAGIMYLLLIRPQQAQKRRMQEMLDKLGPGDEVITIGGIYGDVVEVYDDKVVLEIAEDVHIEVTRRAIANLVPPETETEEPEEAEEPEADEHLAEADEPSDEATEAAEASDEVEERTR